MTTTCSYGTWTNYSTSEAEPIDGVRSWLGEFEGDYDVDAIVADYVAAINTALPDGVTLVGSAFYGPAVDGRPPHDFPVPEVAAAIDAVELAPIVERHDTSEVPAT